MFGKKEYPNLENALEKKGYYITGKWETPSTRLINTLGKKSGRKKYIIKAELGGREQIHGIKNEAYYAKILKKIPGIINILDSGSVGESVRHIAGDSHPKIDTLCYVIKEYLPTPISKVTEEMKQQMLQTQKEVHSEGIRYERDLAIDDFRLDKDGNVKLMDLEELRPFDRSKIVQKLDDRLALLRVIDYHKDTLSSKDKREYYGVLAQRWGITLAKVSWKPALGLMGLVAAGNGCEGVGNDNSNFIDYAMAIGGGALIVGGTILSGKAFFNWMEAADTEERYARRRIGL